VSGWDVCVQGKHLTIGVCMPHFRNRTRSIPQGVLKKVEDPPWQVGESSDWFPGKGNQWSNRIAMITR